MAEPSPPASGGGGSVPTAAGSGGDTSATAATTVPPPNASTPQGTKTSSSPAPQSTSTPPPAAQFRPSPVRSFTMGNPYLTTAGGKARATSQPPGDKLPSSSPASGRGSPGMNGGSDFGVIGGSRTPGKVGPGPGLVPTRASSFSVADKIDQRPSSLVRTLSSHVEERPTSRSTSPSPFPTFSPSSSPDTNAAPGQYSPPIAPANVSRSRSQSLATGVRPDRNFVMPMSAFEPPSSGFRFDEGWRKDSSNMSPFTSNSRGFPDDDNKKQRPTVQTATSYHNQNESGFGNRAWASPTTTSALTVSVTNALGSQPTYSSVVGGFDDAANGGRSGTSSRRHSVSVVGGGGARRGYGFNDPQAMSATVPRRGIGSLGFTDDELLPERFDNALSLQVEEKRAPSRERESTEVASSLPIFSGVEGPRSAIVNPPAEPFFSSSPASDRELRGRFGFERSKSFAVASGTSPDPAPREGRPGPVGAPVRAPPNVGAIGTVFEQPPGRFGGGPTAASPTSYRGFNPPLSAPPAGTFGRPPVPSGPGFGFYGGIGQPPPQPRPPFPQNGGGFGGLGPAFGGPYPQTGFPGGLAPPGPNYFGGPPLQQQQPPASPSSFSSLSLADLGKGIPLASLAPTTPLYIVTFKAGRRDVFYCPDPTLLISNGDRVIVEADRGSDLGTVVYDQLTPVEVREWQERQATAALLSGASQHQPPGMAMAGVSNPQQAPQPSQGHTRNGSQGQRPPAPGSVDFTGADLNALLSGVGPSGSQMDMGGGGIGARGPLAKEIMPKRIFAKSAGGPEEQARMMEKLKDEYDAMMICREKVAQRGLPMQIVDAEYQWDRRKLTFYFKADKRVDFRELTKENFRIFKSRIWMSMVPKDDPRG